MIYGQLPAARRQELHRRIALREEAAYGLQATQIAGRLAIHFEQAQDATAAVRYRVHASRNALAVGGYREVLGHAAAGLDRLAAVPAGTERNEHALALQLFLGMAAAATQGFAAARAERAYGRALEISRDAPNTPASTGTLFGLYAYHLMRGRIPQAQDIAAQILSGGTQAGAPASIVWGRIAVGVASLHAGDVSAARAALEAARAVYDPRQRPVHASIHPLEPDMLCLAHLSWCLWLLGYPAEALARSRAAVRAAERTGQPGDRACALLFASFLHAFRREGAPACACGRAALEVSTKYELHQWLAPSTIAHGWGRAARGEVTEGIADMRSGIEAWRAVGADYGVPMNLALLADVLGRHGEVEDALKAVDEALRLAQANDDRFWEPEISHPRRDPLRHCVDRSIEGCAAGDRKGPRRARPRAGAGPHAAGPGIGAAGGDEPTTLHVRSSSSHGDR